MKLFRKIALILTVVAVLLLGSVVSFAAEYPPLTSEEEYEAEPDPEEPAEASQTIDPFAFGEDEELELDDEIGDVSVSETEPNSSDTSSPLDTTLPLSSDSPLPPDEEEDELPIDTSIADTTAPLPGGSEITSNDTATETQPAATSSIFITGTIPEQYLTSSTSESSETYPTDTLPPETTTVETTTPETTAPIIYETPAPTAAETTVAETVPPDTTISEETTTSEDDAIIGEISSNSDTTSSAELTTPVSTTEQAPITTANPSRPEAAEPFPVTTVVIVAVVLIAVGVAAPLVFNYFRKKKIYTY